MYFPDSAQHKNGFRSCQSLSPWKDGNPSERNIGESMRFGARGGSDCLPNVLPSCVQHRRAYRVDPAGEFPRSVSMALPRVNAPFPEVGPCVGKRKATGVDRPSGLRTHGRGMRLTGLFGDWGVPHPGPLPGGEGVKRSTRRGVLPLFCGGSLALSWSSQTPPMQVYFSSV